MKKQDKNKIELIDGQLSIFDIQVTEKTKKITEKEVSFTETTDFVTENKESFTNVRHEVTEEQQKVIDDYKASKYVNRVVIYSKGSIGIEVKEDNNLKTHYITRNGKEEFSFENKSSVMPWDRIIYYREKKVPLTKVQVDKLQALLNKDRDCISRVIHRKGDENILLEVESGVISITPIGWKLPFESLDHIDCEEDEVYLIPAKTIHEDRLENLEEIQRKVKVGDYVQAMHGKEIIEGTIVHEYGLGNEILNIVFGTKHTAIGRIAVKKILKSA